MKTYVILLDVSSDDLYAWLHDCIEIAQNELALLPSRPRPAAMLPRQVPLHRLYRFVREVADWCVGVYEAPPETTPPFGVPLLLLGRLRIEAVRPDHVPI